MTPRERADDTWLKLLEKWRRDGVGEDEDGEPSEREIMETAVVEDRRALVADDEATIEAMARAHSPRRWEAIDKMRPETHGKYKQDLVDADFVAMRAALAALRRKTVSRE